MDLATGDSLVTLGAVFGTGLLIGLIIGKLQSGHGSSDQGMRDHALQGPVPHPSPDVQDLIRQNNLIDAIKQYREETGLGLKESKDAVENWKRRNT